MNEAENGRNRFIEHFNLGERYESEIKGHEQCQLLELLLNLILT